MSNIKLFESKQVRAVWNDLDQKWYFVVEDVVAVLTDSTDPKQYIKRMILLGGNKTQNLRDHMNDLELIFSMLGEASTTAIVKNKKPQRVY